MQLIEVAHLSKSGIGLMDEIMSFEQTMYAEINYFVSQKHGHVLYFINS